MTVPLFGRDSIPHKTSSFFGIVGTVVFWLIFILCGLFIPMKPAKKNLKPVQIVLSSTPIVEKTEKDSQSSSPRVDDTSAANVDVVAETPGEPMPEPESAPQIVQEQIQEVVAAPVIQEVVAPVVPKLAETLPSEPKAPAEPKANINPVQKVKEKTVEKPKPAPKKETPPVPAKKADPVKEVQETEPVLYKSVDDLLAEQMNTPKKSKANFDWDSFDNMFSDNESATSTNTNTTKKVETQNTVAGVAGQTKETAVKKTESTSVQKRETAGTSSTATSENLSKIKNATAYNSSSGGSLGSVKAKTISSGTGSTSMEMSNGSVRALLYPPEPVITLPEDASKYIDNDITVKISFMVSEGGNIFGIKFTPESILNEYLRDSISKQLMDWRFESASESAGATFEYTIKKQ